MIAKGKNIVKRLPIGYIELEYIESANSQWIDLDIVGTTDELVKFGIELTVSKSSNSIYGTSGSTDSNQMYLAFYDLKLRQRLGNGHVETSNLNLNQKYDVEAKMTSGNHYVKVDGEILAQGTRTVVLTNRNDHLFAFNNTGTAWNKGTYKLYYFKLYQNNVLKRNMIPAKRENDGAIGMYDLVSNAFFENKSSTSFVSGNELKDYYEINNIKLGVELPTSEPLDTSQNKTAGSGYSSGQLKWNGDYSISKIKTIKANGNIQLSGGDSWLRLYVSLSDGTIINREWGNGSINKTVEDTTNSGIHYTMKVEQYNVIYTFDDYVIPTDIYMETYTKYGTWRAEGFNINLYVTGYTILANEKQIQSVMLGTKEIWSNYRVPYYRRMDFSSTNHYSMSCAFDTNDLANILVTKFVVCSTTRRMQGDSYVNASCATKSGTKWNKNSWFNNGTRTETGTFDGIPYTLTGESGDNLGRYTMEFDKPIKLSAINGGCGSGVGQWRETDRMYIEVTGLSKG